MPTFVLNVLHKPRREEKLKNRVQDQKWFPFCPIGIDVCLSPREKNDYIRKQKEVISPQNL